MSRAHKQRALKNTKCSPVNGKVFYAMRAWIFASIVVFSILWGIAVCYIPWGSNTGLHGQGFPIARVMWDKASRHYELSGGQADYFIDFPNSLALVENPISYFVFLMGLWGLIELTIWLLEKSKLIPIRRNIT